ncbi:RICIN domain-containing protein [Streptomyces sp. NPDC052013]|uniref:RICIN domain-containing protein n=1 Tax=Streptomyces sp. NPDC052013 TaxID=3365679 RepID=UPI0037D6AD8B
MAQGRHGTAHRARGLRAADAAGSRRSGDARPTGGAGVPAAGAPATDGTRRAARTGTAGRAAAEGSPQAPPAARGRPGRGRRDRNDPRLPAPAPRHRLQRRRRTAPCLLVGHGLRDRGPFGHGRPVREAVTVRQHVRRQEAGIQGDRAGRGRCRSGKDKGGSQSADGSGTSGDPAGSGGDGDAGSGSGGGSGGSSGTEPEAPATGGTVLRNGSSGQCLSANGNSAYGNVITGPCDSGAAVWNLQGVSAGTYRFFHKASGGCLSSYGALHNGTCGADDAQRWRLGPAGSIVSADTGKCLEAATNGMGVMQTCDGSAAQRWTRS